MEAFAHERADRHAPAVVDVADPQSIGEIYVSQQNFVELGITGQLAEWKDRDAGGVHVAHEEGQTGLLRDVRSGPGQQEAPSGDVCERRPHLVTVDAPTLAVLDGKGAHGREIRPGRRFAEELTPHLLAGEDLPEVPLSLIRRTVG